MRNVLFIEKDCRQTPYFLEFVYSLQAYNIFMILILSIKKHLK